jgi:dipeptidyl aminopeptidase/acylaminoacyl peptidase
MALVDEAIRRGTGDPRRLGVGGWSYGGYLTNVVVTRTTRFRAAVSGASIANLLGIFGVNDAAGRWVAEFGLPWDDLPRWKRSSPYFDVARVQTPVLVMCGADDMRTPLSQSEQWYQALRGFDRTAELVIYPGEGHGLTRGENRRDGLRREIAWYDRFLRTDAGAP